MSTGEATSEDQVTGTDFITIPVTDYERSAAFYGDVLGLTFSKRWGQMPAGEFETGSLTLALMQSDAFGQTFSRSSSAIALHVGDVAAARARIEAHGVSFRGEIMDTGVCFQTFFADPDGNPLILHHRYAPHA